MSSLDLFSSATQQWFSQTFAAPTPAQEAGWEAIAGGADTLIHAPTGSGKTLAAFLWAIDRLAIEETPADPERCRVLYISPLKALAYDVDRNLRAPLTGIRHAAERAGGRGPQISVAMRTGDTPQSERRQMHRSPPDILITTPESLYLMLTSQVSEILASVRWVIIDEIHSVAGSKRGAHLALTLERLEEIATTSPQRIGLSATQRPLDRIAHFLGGGAIVSGTHEPRPVTIVDAPKDKELDLEIVVPVEDMTRPDLDVTPSGPAAGGQPSRSIWPAMYPELLDLVEKHRSTIIFANSRGLAERIANELNALAEHEIAKAHHGSVSREQRIAIEDGLKKGTLKCVVATSSLELGVDMEAVDLVILVESPTSVARGMQRVGRAGHQVGVPSRAKVFPKHRGDLLEAALIVDRMVEGAIESTAIPQNPLDVLSQQVVAMVSMRPWNVDELYDTVRRATPYAELGRGPFEATLDMLAGRYPSDDFAELRPKIVWDRVTNIIEPRPGAKILAVTNAGTIPDRGLYSVMLPEGGKVGELDEEMVYESRVGDTFILGSSTWQITDITADRVEVIPAPGAPAARMPFWHGDSLGRPLETGRALGAFIRTIGELEPAEAVEVLQRDYRLDPRAAGNLAGFIAEEKAATGALPSDRTIVVETFRDEIGDWRTVILTPFGSRVHAPWALAAARVIRQRHGIEVDSIWSDDGVVLRFPDADAAPDVDDLFLDPDDIEDLVVAEAGHTALFTSRFREAAGRALLLPRRKPGRRTPLWLQRRRAADLLEAARRYPAFPIVLEAYREVLQEYFDLPALTEVLGEVRSRKIRTVAVETPTASPFASSLMFDFIANFMYDYDAPPAERRAMALTVDQALLRDLLGEPELRELLDADVISQVELELQRLDPARHARTADGITDMLRSLGPLSLTELRARVAPEVDLDEAIETLAADRRIAEVAVGGASRWAAMEDMGRLRDALGVTPPVGVPDAFLEPVADPLGDVISRYARTHGPFSTAQLAADLGLPRGVVDRVIAELEDRGRVVAGAFRPGGRDREWVDTEVLRRLRRRSLAVLRSEVEAVDDDQFARFLVGWHGVGQSGGGRGRLIDVIRRLQGAAVPASILERDVLGMRMSYTPELLDSILATGEIVWVGRGPLGSRDGRVALYLRDQVGALAWPLDHDAPDSPIHEAIRTHLAERGASFFRELYSAAGGGDQDVVLEALWDLVWAGEVTNDTAAPLRARLSARSRKSRGPQLGGMQAPPSATGRWYLVSDLAEGVDDTRAQTARADQLLERHGVVTRDAVLAESVPGGFAGLYPVYSVMEEAGRIRRGYFVEGRGGAQFALPGAVDRLRAASTDEVEVTVVAAADPANPYGAALGWPAEAEGRAGRVAGAYVVLVAGQLAAFVERGGKRVLTFGDIDGYQVASGIAEVALRHVKRMVVESVDGAPVAESSLAPVLEEHGFVASYKGLAHRARR